jgi:hypothetical protein
MPDLLRELENINAARAHLVAVHAAVNDAIECAMYPDQYTDLNAGIRDLVHELALLARARKTGKAIDPNE